MGKQTKLREAQRCVVEQALAARLHQHGRRKAPAFIATYGEFSQDYLERLEPYRPWALRAPELWRCKLRARAPELRFLELVKFTFARFSVPPQLENAWLAPLEAAPCGAADAPDFRRWYIAAAQGRSLYRELAHPMLSRGETHHFLAAPASIKTPRRALWYAVARTAGSASGALRIARTKLVARPLNAFWKEVARYFARNDPGVLETNDLIDFIEAARIADPAFGLNGLTLAGLRRRMLAWHQALRRGEQVGSERWVGASLPNSRYEIDGLIWRFKQIKNAQRLFEEGERMHHCVLSYKNACIGGESFIWSLSCETEGRLIRCLTLEVAPTGLIVQARGFANRVPSAIEIAVITRWAAEHGLIFYPWPHEELENDAAA